MHADKTFLIDKIMQQAYDHPKFARLRIPNTTICPNCMCEIAHVLHDSGDLRTLWCAYCGTTYRDRELIA